MMKTTLDEWEILQTVVQLGGFAPAAELLNRAVAVEIERDRLYPLLKFI